MIPIKRKAKNVSFLLFSLLLAGCDSSDYSSSSAITGGEALPSCFAPSEIMTERKEEKKEWNQFKAEIEISQKISDTFELYLKGSWDLYKTSSKLIKKSDFVYEAVIQTKVDSLTTYDYYVLINNDDKFKEHILKEEDNKICFDSGEEEIILFHKVMDFENYPIAENQWTILNGPTSNVTETEKGIKIENYSWQSGFVCQKNTLGEKNYTMSAHFKGTKMSPYTDETYIGLAPYYFDSKNYLFAYVQWCNWDGFQSIVREIGFTGFINGESAGWNDIFNMSAVSTTPLTGFTLTIDRTATGFNATFVGDDKQTFSGTKNFSNLKKGSDYLGIYVQNDIVEVSDYQVKES